MSSTDARRAKRKQQQLIKKGLIEEQLVLPTERDVEEYVLNKSKELRVTEQVKTN